MPNSSVEWLATAIGQATRSAKFVVTGRLPTVDPELEVEELGRVPVPLKRAIAKSLIAVCRVAPYGKGTETLVDTRVRKTFELDAQKFRLGDQWNSAIADAMRAIADSLGLPADRLEARLYKLLVYEKGGFFLPHRDSEKLDRMVASLIVVLPNPFEGGKLIVRHNAVTQNWRTGVPLRDVEWLAAFCDPSADPARSRVAGELCEIAVKRFCEPRPQRPIHDSSHYRREISVAEESLPLLLQALAASDRDENLSRAIRFVRELPDEFSLDDARFLP